MRHYTDRPGALACRAAPVASGVKAVEQRPSMSAATSHRRSARPRSTATIARTRRPLVVVMSGAFRNAWGWRRVSLAGPAADGLHVLHAGDAGGQFRRQQPVVSVGNGVPFSEGQQEVKDRSLKGWAIGDGPTG